MGEPRARMLQVLGLLGTPFPTSSELRTGAMYRGGKMDAMAGGPTRSEFEDEQIRKVSDLGLNLFGIFKGVKGATKAEKQALLKAQEMARAGADRDEIWNATLWYKGKDGKWRTEIDDSGARPGPLSTSDVAKLEKGDMAITKRQNALLHPGVSAAYQDTKDIPVNLYKNRTGGTYASDETWPKGYIRAPGTPQGADKSVMLHELQHAIQQREGMARGGSPEAMAAEAWNTPKELQLARRIVELSQQFPPARVEQIMQQYGDPGVVKNAKLMVDKLGADTVNRLYDESLAENAAEGYKRLLGEVDARNTQKRMDMTLDQRRQFPPWTTWDVPEADQIVRMEGGRAMSIADTSMDDLAAQLDAMRAANKAKGLPIETGTGDLRGEIARRNAVSLLGLPETNTAADRALAMGIDTPVFRGSPTPNRPEPDVTLGWASTSPEVANTYALKHRLRGGSWEEPESSFAPYVMPLLAKVDETIDARGAQFHSVPFENMVMSADDVKNRIWPKSVKIANVKDVGGGKKDIVADSVAAYPRNIRSRFAAFDPARRDEADLLAGLLPYAIPAGLLGMFLTRPGEGYE